MKVVLTEMVAFFLWFLRSRNMFNCLVQGKELLFHLIRYDGQLRSHTTQAHHTSLSNLAPKILPDPCLVHLRSVKAAKQVSLLSMFLLPLAPVDCISRLLQLWQSGPFCSRYTRLLFLPEAGARCINSAKFSTEQTGSLTWKQRQIQALLLIFRLGNFLLLFLLQIQITAIIPGTPQFPGGGC